eukprot:TRINITY_DN423_c2_g1_i1.p1 TRINITY_DN423_c2_g1~~TRINITY_DN423_c2_g1_i1.p1  ORF type:complete len:501 (+),score=173.33 TRINITY_DN423_c2_g1_i1:51-1553(+)
MSKQMLADRPESGNAKGGRKRREIIPIPADAPKMPSYDEMNANIQKVRDTVEKHKKKMEELKARNDNLGGESEERKQAREELKKLRDDKAKLLTDLSSLRTKNRKIAEEARNTEREIREVTSELRKEQRGGNIELDPKAIDNKIKELEFKIESGGVGSLKGERRVMQEIKQYTAMKEKSKELLAKSDGMLDAKSRAEKSRGERDSNQKVIDSLTDDLTTVIDAITKVKETLDATSSNDERAKIRQEKDDLREEINKCFAEMDKIRATHKEKKEAYNEWKKDYDKEVEAEIKRQREARALKEKEDAERREKDAIEYEELKKLNPYEDEIKECTVLIDYLKRKADLKHTAPPASKKTENTEEFDAAKAMLKFDGKGSIQLGRKDDSADFFQMKKGKKPQKKAHSPPPKKTAPAAAAAPVKAAPAKQKSLTHEHNKGEVFRKYGLTLPLYAHECKGMIATLEEKVAEYKTHIKTPAQLAAERSANAAAEAAKKAAEEAAKDEE